MCNTLSSCLSLSVSCSVSLTHFRSLSFFHSLSYFHFCATLIFLSLLLSLCSPPTDTQTFSSFISSSHCVTLSPILYLSPSLSLPLALCLSVPQDWRRQWHTSAGPPWAPPPLPATTAGAPRAPETNATDQVRVSTLSSLEPKLPNTTLDTSIPQSNTLILIPLIH